MFRLIPLLLSLAISGCSSVDVQRARTMSDADLKRHLTEPPGVNTRPACLVGFMQDNHKPGLMCELVRQDRRALIEDIVTTEPKLLTCMPILACAPHVEAYQHWKSRGATLELSGTSTGDSIRALQPIQSLVVAAGTANAAIVAQHLLDGADPRRRTWYAGSALGQALRTWHASLNWPEQEGFGPGLTAPGKELGATGGEAVSRRHAAPSADIVRMLIEAGANLEDPSAAGAMGQYGVGYPGWWTPGQTYLDVFTRHIPGLAELGRQAQDVRQNLENCRRLPDREACVRVVERAGPHSPSRIRAREQIARIDAEATEWQRLTQGQPCRVQRQDWLYEGDACAGAYAQGRGAARSRDGGSRIEGQFDQGHPSSGRVMLQGSLHYEGPLRGWKPDGIGVCWHEGQPEECRMLDGQRIDALHKQREESRRLLEAQRKQAEAARRALEDQAREDRREKQRQDQEDRRERRQAQAFVAGMAAMRGDYGPAAAAGLPGADTLRIQQQANQARTQAQQAVRESPRQRDTPRPPAGTNAAAAAVSAPTPSAQALTSSTPTPPARAEVDREAARKKAEEDRLAKQQAYEQRKAGYLAEVKDAIRLKVLSCGGRHVLSGSRGRVKELFDVTSCVDVRARAYCPGDRSGVSAVATNFVGMGGCLGDTYPLQGTPACDAEVMRVEIEEVRSCR